MTDHDEMADEVSDDVLADRVRSGDDDAYGILWQRHAQAGLAAARPLAALGDPDDLVSEAYLAIFRALRNGGGPREAFRPYLYRTIRNIAYTRARTEQPVSLEVVGEVEADGDLETTAVENTLTTRAFRTLPERWQTVLWYSEVEGMQPAEFGPLLGLTANSGAALASRAREGFRKAWLQAHVNDHRVPEGCRWSVDRMGEYARGGLTPRARLRFERHVDGCTRCAILLEEVDEVGRHLAIALIPLVLGAGAGLAWLRDRNAPGPSTSAARDAEVALGRTSSHHPIIAATALTGVAALIVVAATLAGLPHRETPDPGSAPATGSTEPAAPAPTPTDPAPTDPAPSDPPVEAAPPAPVRPAPPAPPAPPRDTTAPGPVALAGPADASLGNDPRPEFRGTGEPGSRVDVEVPTAGTPVVGVEVGPDGSWSLRPDALPDGIHSATVTQTDRAGNRSAPVTVTFEVDTVALAPVIDPLAATHVTLPVVTGTAEPGATVDLLADGIPTVSTLADAAGEWAVDLPDPGAATMSLTVRQTDRAGNTSPETTPIGLTFELPEVLSPVSGSSLPSTGGATIVTVEFDGVAGREVEVFIDGQPTGNTHLLTGTPLTRVTGALADGEHVISFRYTAGGRPGATIDVVVTIVP